MIEKPSALVDYFGHGLSGGDLSHAGIGDWLEESIAMWEMMGEEPPIVAAVFSMRGNARK